MPVIIPLAAAAVGAGATILSSSKASSAANNATQAQTQASQAAIAAQTQASQAALGEQQREYDQNRTDLAPWRQVGMGALNQLAQTEGITIPSGAAASFGGDTAIQTAQNPTSQPSGTATVNGKQVQIGGADPGVHQSGAMWIDNSSGQPQLKVWDESSGRYGIPNAQQQASFLGGQTTAQVAASVPAASSPASSPPGVTAGSSTTPANTVNYGAFQASPDYDFRFNEGERAVTGNYAARGLLDSGALGKGLIDYGQGAASQEYGNWYNRIAALAGVGQTATNTGVSAGQATANNISNLTTQQGQNLASSYTNQGNIAAQGAATQGGIQAGLINSIGNTTAGLITNLGTPKVSTSQTPIMTGTLPYTPAGSLPPVSSTLPNASYYSSVV